MLIKQTVEIQYKVMNKCKSSFFRRSTVPVMVIEDKIQNLKSPTLRIRKGLQLDIWKIKIAKC